MTHFREARQGRYYLERDGSRYAQDQTAVMRFTGSRGFADAGWRAPAGVRNPTDILAEAGLLWRVEDAELDTVETVFRESRRVDRYRALIHPPTGEVMDVVQTSYTVAENEEVAATALDLARALDSDAALVGAASFGRNDRQTVFAVRVADDATRTLVLVATNSHGGEGAVRFRLQYVSRVSGATMLPDPGKGLRTAPHRDRVSDRLATLARSDFVADYAHAVEASLARLGKALWSPRHTSAVIEKFWPASARWEKKAADESQLFLGDPESADLHPGKHLEWMLADCTDAGTAYEVLCVYLDLHSEACKSGDFIADRDERLVNGAVEEIKNRIWTWVVGNT